MLTIAGLALLVLTMPGCREDEEGGLSLTPTVRASPTTGPTRGGLPHPLRLPKSHRRQAPSLIGPGGSGMSPTRGTSTT
jgi:hypothetical protein